MSHCLKLINSHYNALQQLVRSISWFDHADQLRASTYVICITLLILSIPSIALNALLLVTVWRVRSLQVTSNLFLCNLALSDLAIGLVVQPFAVAWKLSEFLSTDLESNCRIASTSIMLSFTFVSVSIVTITLVTVYRYLALCLHLSYKSTVTSKRVILVFGGVWFAGLAFSFLTLLGARIFHIAAAVVISSCHPTMTFCYYKIYQVLKYHHAKINQSMHVSQETTGLASMLAWNITGTILYFNSSVNPLNYYWKLREIRNSVNETINLVCPCIRISNHNAVTPIQSNHSVQTVNS
ncbi:5-hydroxytryptamine receptor 1E-like [Nematostella vectensis]|uniref:5-hydroxytryptamine receptor 1E-like n=1 Tax=Nematostella vectensis TaxID=45351 RepID=UPI00207744B1|nr:5-hydroxytryptamine receptor 1E-like [Nematostella vectensis]